MEQIQLDDRDDKLYDVTCDLSKESCMADPDTVCDVHDITEVVYLGMNSTTFEDAFDGDAPTGRRRRLDSQKDEHSVAYFPGFSRDFDCFDLISGWDGRVGSKVGFDCLIFVRHLIV